jgi:hypothetical protein
VCLDHHPVIFDGEVAAVAHHVVFLDGDPLSCVLVA